MPKSVEELLKAWKSGSIDDLKMLEERSRQPIVYGVGAAGIRIGEDIDDHPLPMSVSFDSSWSQEISSKEPVHIGPVSVLSKPRIVADRCGVTFTCTPSGRVKSATVGLQYLGDLDYGTGLLNVETLISPEVFEGIYRGLVPSWLQVKEPWGRHLHLSLDTHNFAQDVEVYAMPGLVVHASADRRKVFRITTVSANEFMSGETDGRVDIPFSPAGAAVLMNTLAQAFADGNACYAPHRSVFVPGGGFAHGRLLTFSAPQPPASLVGIWKATIVSRAESMAYFAEGVSLHGARLQQYRKALFEHVEPNQKSLLGYSLGESFMMNWHAMDALMVGMDTMPGYTNNSRVEIGGIEEHSSIHYMGSWGARRFRIPSLDLAFYTDMPAFESMFDIPTSEDMEALLSSEYKGETHTGRLIGIACGNQLGTANIHVGSKIHRLGPGSLIPEDVAELPGAFKFVCDEGDRTIGDTRFPKTVDEVLVLPDLGLMFELLENTVSRIGIADSQWRSKV